MRYKGSSFLHCEWVSAAFMREQGTWGVIKARKFLGSDLGKRHLDEEEERMEAGRDPLPADAYFDEDLVTVERIIATRTVDVDDAAADAQALVDAGGMDAAAAVAANRSRRMYLVKWRGLPYGEATWEFAADIKDVRSSNPWGPPCVALPGYTCILARLPSSSSPVAGYQDRVL